MFRDNWWKLFSPRKPKEQENVADFLDTFRESLMSFCSCWKFPMIELGKRSTVVWEAVKLLPPFSNYSPMLNCMEFSLNFIAFANCFLKHEEAFKSKSWLLLALSRAPIDKCMIIYGQCRSQPLSTPGWVIDLVIRTFSSRELPCIGRKAKKYFARFYGCDVLKNLMKAYLPSRVLAARTSKAAIVAIRKLLCFPLRD